MMTASKYRYELNMVVDGCFEPVASALTFEDAIATAREVLPAKLRGNANAWFISKLVTFNDGRSYIGGASFYPTGTMIKAVA